MKVYVVALSLFAVSAAHGQSSITIYGVLDLAVRDVKNGDLVDLKSLASGGNLSSRLGLRGNEDLGGHYYAGFDLEGDIAADTGVFGSLSVQDQIWSRLSYVDIGGPFGEFRLGYDYVPTFTGTWNVADPFGNVGVGGAGNLLSIAQTGPLRAAFGPTTNRNESTTIRARNMVEYFLPGDLGGFNGMVFAAAGEGGSAVIGQNKATGGRLGYSAGRLFLSAAAIKTKNSTTAAKSFKDVDFSAGYDFGAVRVSAAWRRFSFDTSKQTDILVGTWIPVGLDLIIASYQMANFQGRVGATNIDANDANQIALGYVKFLTKRTQFYGTVSRISNQGLSSITVPGGRAGNIAGKSSRGAELGIVHRF